MQRFCFFNLSLFTLILLISIVIIIVVVVIIIIIIIITVAVAVVDVVFLDIGHGTFTSLVFATTGRMGKEFLRYHSRQAELISVRKESNMPKIFHESEAEFQLLYYNLR